MPASSGGKTPDCRSGQQGFEPHRSSHLSTDIRANPQTPRTTARQPERSRRFIEGAEEVGASLASRITLARTLITRSALKVMLFRSATCWAIREAARGSPASRSMATQLCVVPLLEAFQPLGWPDALGAVRIGPGVNKPDHSVDGLQVIMGAADLAFLGLDLAMAIGPLAA
jgi:hypothetical protein